MELILKQMIEALTQVVKLLQRQIELQQGKSKRELLFDEAVRSLGTDVSPVYNEYGCAESVNTIAKRAIGKAIGGDVSTYRMYKELHNDKRFKKVDTPMEGDIVISPTGHGNGGLSNGHVGIVGIDNKIMSNTSGNSLWEYNYTIDKWYNRYVGEGGYPMDYFRLL